MERICNNIAERISLELELDKERKEVIAYGMFALLQMVLSIGLVIIFGILFDVIYEAVIISFTTSILRKYSGGIHASSPGRCAIIGTISCIGQALLVELLVNQGISFKLVLILGVINFVWSYYIICKLAPVDSPAKPIKKKEKRKRMKKGSIIILSAYLIFIVIMITVYKHGGNSELIKYCLCIYIGVLWQVFTITSYGHLFLRKIDIFFTHIIKL